MKFLPEVLQIRRRFERIFECTVSRIKIWKLINWINTNNTQFSEIDKSWWKSNLWLALLLLSDNSSMRFMLEDASVEVSASCPHSIIDWTVTQCFRFVDIAKVNQQFCRFCSRIFPISLDSVQHIVRVAGWVMLMIDQWRWNLSPRRAFCLALVFD